MIALCIILALIAFVFAIFGIAIYEKRYKDETRHAIGIMLMGCGFILIVLAMIALLKHLNTFA